MCVCHGAYTLPSHRRRYPDKRIPLPDMNLPDVGSGTADVYAPRGEVPTSMVRVGVSRPAITSTGQRRVERGKGVRSSLAEEEAVSSSKQTRTRVGEGTNGRMVGKGGWGMCVCVWCVCQDNVEVGGAGVDGVGGERRVSGKRSMSPSTALPTKASDMPFFTHDYPLNDDGDDRDDKQDDEGDNQDEGDRWVHKDTQARQQAPGCCAAFMPHSLSLSLSLFVCKRVAGGP